MRRMTISSSLRQTHGQSMIETALLLPILLLIAFNAINFGYFFYVAVNMAAAPRSGVQYAIIGGSTPASPQLPPVGPTGGSCPTATSSTALYVCTLVFQDMSFLSNFATGGGVQVCSSTLGFSGSGSSQKANCSQYGGPAYTPASDPEAPNFVLGRVDVTYVLTPILPAFQLPTPGGPISLVLIPNLTMHRQVSMREMN
ncbi:MAG: TadE/TadG family type IV pilus assembly protein [Terriglobia bacterium]